jgi:transcription-repair coupling factor (superfamily II helicase)
MAQNKPADTPHNSLHDTGPAASLVEHIGKLAEVRRVGAMLDEGRRRIDMSGLSGSSPMFVVEALRERVKRTVVVCCSDEEQARDACSDLGTVSSGRVEFFPAKDIFPQPFDFKENLTVRGKRNACLDRILQGEVDIVVTSLAGLREKTITLDTLRDHAREFRVGDHIDLEALLSYLVSVGYERNGIVEELGQFAVRGSIIDIFDPSWDHPLRLELFDDEITSIRAFDIDNQRSIGQSDIARVLPATGVFVEEETLRELEKQLREQNFDGDTIDEIRHEIEHHRFSYLVRRYAPALGMQGSLLDFFDAPPVLVFCDEAGMQTAVEVLESDYAKVERATEDYPIMALDRYLLPPDYYTTYEVPAVHVWSRSVHTDGDGPPPDTVTCHATAHPTVLGKIDSLLQLIRRLRDKGNDVLVFSDTATQRERLADMLEDVEELVHLPVGWVTSGFVWNTAGFALLTDHEIFHRSLPRPSDRRKTRRAHGMRAADLQVGDFVVHVDYGIGRYVGLEKVNTQGGDTECLNLRYHGSDRIFVPLDQIPFVEKYVGKDSVLPVLDRLGSSKWQRTKEKTKKALANVAKEMLRVYAAREVAERPPFSADSQWQKELEASFPFEETPHQLRAAAEIKSDLESSRPMDRLICGDVGFGKTEVAVRAAFKAINDGKQVAVVVPTTILALQHFKTFQERMAVFPLRIEMLSRFRTPQQQADVVKGLKDGTVDLVVGTHRLLSKDVGFHDIGLMVVDEEHRFGVRSKEKIKRLKTSVDVLAMTATPIPRTLYMALSGLRPISVIDTPPRNRHPVLTEVIPFDEDTIAKAIRAEVARGGQAFFLHNRVASIHSMQAFLQRLLPEVTFCVGHGQMPEKQLESTILDFVDGKYDVLISTTIIESGLDFPNVNTIIINRADRFGLADLYQLRGRVGRRERQAYAYLLVPRNFSITHNASRRLHAMEEFEELGSGYRLAMRDLEIRGAGNVLGTEQHGRLVAVGFDLYCKMLKEAVDELQGQSQEEVAPARIETRLSGYLPSDYVEDQNERMAIYKRLAAMESPEDLDRLADELRDRFGPPPVEAINLIALTRVKLLATRVGVGVMRFHPDRFVLELKEGKSFAPRLCAQLVETFEGRVLFKSGDNFGLTLTHAGSSQGDTRLEKARKLLEIVWQSDIKGES